MFGRRKASTPEALVQGLYVTFITRPDGRVEHNKVGQVPIMTMQFPDDLGSRLAWATPEFEAMEDQTPSQLLELIGESGECRFKVNAQTVEGDYLKPNWGQQLQTWWIEKTPEWFPGH